MSKRDRIEAREHLFSGVTNDKTFVRFALFIAFFIVTVIIAYFAHFYGNFSPFDFSNDPSIWGAFGDYFAGLVNPILGLFTFFLVAATVYFTKQMLDTTREEMRNAQREMARQNFDGRITYLISLFREVREGLRFTHPVIAGQVGKPIPHRQEYRGQDAIQAQFDDLLTSLTNNIYPTMSDEDLHRYISGFSLLVETTPSVRPYFKCLSAVLTVLASYQQQQHFSSTVNTYRRLISTLLSDEEILVIYIYSIASGLHTEENERLHEFVIVHCLEGIPDAIRATVMSMELARCHNTTD